MARQRQAVRVRQDQPFKARQFTAEVILWAVRWYLMFPISYRDLELMLLDRGVEVDHTTIFVIAHPQRRSKRGKSVGNHSFFACPGSMGYDSVWTCHRHRPSPI